MPNRLLVRGPIFGPALACPPVADLTASLRR